MKPSANEQEYFARHEDEMRERAAREHQQKLLVENRQREKTLHFMKCPKCGAPLAEFAVGEVTVDKCAGCDGIWLDKGEIEAIRKEEAGFIGRLFDTFR